MRLSCCNCSCTCQKYAFFAIIKKKIYEINMKESVMKKNKNIPLNLRKVAIP